MLTEIIKVSATVCAILMALSEPWRNKYSRIWLLLFVIVIWGIWI